VQFANAISTPNTFGFKNRIINGGMQISQRNGTTATTTTNAYTLDRWNAYQNTTGSMTVQQSSVAPAGFTNSLAVAITGTAVSLGTNIALVRQYIEGYNIADLGYGTSNSKTVTLSFWVQSSATGTYCGTVQDAGDDYAYAFTYSIASANTWQQVSITIPGTSSGTWNTTNGRGLDITFQLAGTGSLTANTWQANGTGGNYYYATSAQTNLFAASNTFYITGVQLEKGTQATSFDYRPYGTELQLCQRYCINYNSASANGTYYRYVTMTCPTTTGLAGEFPFPVTMRATPSVTTTGTASNYAALFQTSTIACSAIPAVGGDGSSPWSVNLQSSVASGLTAGYCATLMSNNNNTSYLLFSAEL
jgi:hypothetical protein